MFPEGQLQVKWVKRVRVAPRNPSPAWKKDRIEIDKDKKIPFQQAKKGFFF